MKAFPDHYLSCITRIQTRPDGSRYVWFWAMREGGLTECMADESAYVREFPDRAVNVSSFAIGGSHHDISEARCPSLKCRRIYD